MPYLGVRALECGIVDNILVHNVKLQSVMQHKHWRTIHDKFAEDILATGLDTHSCVMNEHLLCGLD
jgi:hypothetical protein